MATINKTPQKTKKNILLISYHFPPSIAVGGLRISGFAKYLPSFDWIPYVLTINDEYVNEVDIKRLKDLDNLKIFKTRQLPSIIHFYLKLKRVYSSIRERNATVKKLNNSYLNISSNVSEKLPQKLKRYLISLFSLPDAQRRWGPVAIFKAIRVIKRHEIQCILTSSPPQSVHLIGLIVKKITGVKWVADFRDPWMTPEPKGRYPVCSLSLRIERWLEQKVVQNADFVLTNSDWLCNVLKNSYKTQTETKFLCITNGFDSEVFSRLNHLEKYEKFTLTYAGTLYVDRTPEPVFSAIKELIKEGKINHHNISVKLVGNCRYVGGFLIDDIVRSYGLESVIEILDQVPYSKAIEIIKRSHLALLFQPNQPFCIPAKIYDYIGSETKILALTGEGATSDLIRSAGIGIALYPSDIKGIKDFIYESFNNRGLFAENSLKVLSKFNRKFTVQVLADHLNKIT